MSQIHINCGLFKFPNRSLSDTESACHAQYQNPEIKSLCPLSEKVNTNDKGGDCFKSEEGRSCFSVAPLQLLFIIFRGLILTTAFALKMNYLVITAHITTLYTGISYKSLPVCPVKTGSIFRYFRNNKNFHKLWLFKMINFCPTLISFLKIMFMGFR